VRTWPGPSSSSPSSSSSRKLENPQRNKQKATKEKQRGCVTLWPCHLHQLKSILRQRELNYGKLNYFTMQKYNLPQKKKKIL